MEEAEALDVFEAKYGKDDDVGEIFSVKGSFIFTVSEHMSNICLYSI